MARQKEAPELGTVPVRILSEWGGYVCGQYAEVSADLAKQLIRDGIADDSKSAVEYAKSARSVGA